MLALHGYLSSGLMPFQCRQLLKNKWQMLVTWPPEGRRSLSKMPFQPQMLKKKKRRKTQQLHIALSKEQLLVFAAWQWQEKAQSYLCCAPWLIPMWYPDCIMKLDGENAQMLLWVTLPAVGRKAHCLNCATICFVCVWVCAGGGGRARAAEGAYWLQCAVACVARTGGCICRWSVWAGLSRCTSGGGRPVWQLMSVFTVLPTCVQCLDECVTCIFKKGKGYLDNNYSC